MLGVRKNKIKVAINGFGRIGRIIARQIIENPQSPFEIVAIHDLVPGDNLAYLLMYDSTHGQCAVDLEFREDTIFAGFHAMKCVKVTDNKYPWAELGVELVFECTGHLLTTEAAQVHLQSGAKKVIISAPAKDETPMFVYGVNHEEYKGQDVISMASCTTNCLAPIMKVLDREFGVVEALMCTVHSITATQRNLDGPSKKDWRGGRACSESIIPSSTGAAKAVGKVLPSLKGKITGNSYRVPTKDGSIVDLTVKLNKDTSLDEIFQKINEDESMREILEVTSEELVSSDILGCKYSSLIDAKSCIQSSPSFFKIVSWYDNEWGYSARMIDTASYIIEKSGM